MRKILLLFITLITLSCTKENFDSISLSISEKSLNTEEEYQINADSNSDIIYTVENKYHTEVSTSGLVTAKFVGETNILLENDDDQKKLKIIVEPKYYSYPEPDINFKETKTNIIKKYGVHYIQEGNIIGYGNYYNTAPIILFILDDEELLIGYAILVNLANSSNLGNFLSERYLYAGQDEEALYFINGLNLNSASMSVALQLYSEDYFMALYAPLNYQGTDVEVYKTLNINNNNSFELSIKQITRKMK